MWCIGLAPDAWNLSGRCQETQDEQDAGEASQDAQDAGDTTQDAEDAGAADLTSRASGRNGAVSDAGESFADVYPVTGIRNVMMLVDKSCSQFFFFRYPYSPLTL